jgi:hypothetical protein
LSLPLPLDYVCSIKCVFKSHVRSCGLKAASVTLWKVLTITGWDTDLILPAGAGARGQNPAVARRAPPTALDSPHLSSTASSSGDR